VDIEKIIVSIVGDTTKYNKALDDASKKLADTVRRMTEMSGKNPFDGMTEAMTKSAAKMAAAQQLMLRRQQETAKTTMKNQLDALRAFRAVQDKEWADYAKKDQNRRHQIEMWYKGGKGTIDKATRDFLIGVEDEKLAKVSAAQRKAEAKFVERQRQAMFRLMSRQEAERVMAAETAARKMVTDPLGAKPPKTPKTGPSFSERHQQAIDSNFMSAGKFFAISVAANLASHAVTKLGNAFYEAGVYAVTAGAHYEVLQVQLEGLTGSAEKGKKLFEDLLATAVETPFRVKDVVSAAKELKAFGFATEEVNGTVKALGDISAATGTPMHRLILALGQTRIAGRLMGQEMRQFVNSNVPLIEHLSAVMGKPVGQIKKMIENGQVGYADVARALNKLVGEGGRFEGFMDKMYNTIEGRWNSVVDLVEIGFAKVGLSFMKGAGVFEGLTALADWLKGLNADLPAVEQFGKSVADFFKLIGGAAKSVRNFVRDNWEWLQVIGKIAAAMMGMHLAVNLVVGSLKLLVVWTGIAKVAMLIAGAVGLMYSAFMALVTFAPWVAIVGGLATIGVGLFAVFEDFTEFRNRMADLFNGLVNLFHQTMDGITDAIKVGDWQLAGEIAFAGLTVAFKMVIAELKGDWLRFRKWLNDPASGTAVEGGTAKFLNWMTEGRIGWGGVELTPHGKAIAEQLDQMAAEKKRARQAEVEREMAPQLAEYQKPVEEARRKLEELTKKAAKAVEWSNTPEWLKTVIEAERDWRMSGAEHLYDQSVRRQMRNQFPEGSLGFRTMQSQMDVFDEGFQGRAAANARKIAESLARNVALSGIVAAQVVQGMRMTHVANGFTVPYALSPGANTVGEQIQQRYMRGVGEETHKMDFFRQQVRYIEEARTGINADLAPFAESALFGPAARAFGKTQARLSGAEADFGLLDEFDKVRKFVGENKGSGTPVMLQGSAAAQETINRAQTQQVGVLEQVRNILEQGRIMQSQQVEYQKQTVAAIRELVPSGPLPVAPPPREVGFVGN